jgi:hypothetical protein
LPEFLEFQQGFPVNEVDVPAFSAFLIGITPQITF